MPKHTGKTAMKDARGNGAEQNTACRVALIGFGTVGRAVAKILCETDNTLLRLTKICNRNVEKKKQPWVSKNVIWTEDVESVLQSDAEIIIELIGGLTPAEQIVRRALESGKAINRAARP
jgi:homoserine dehydrogenase